MDTKQIQELMTAFNDSDLARMKIKKDDFMLEMDKYSANVAPTAAPAAQPVAVATPAPVESATQSTPEVKKNENALHILSPMVGTFYAAPSPTAPDFVKVGDIVHKGQTVAIVEAMKIMNEIEAEFECKIVDILVKNGQVVEYDMPLFVIEKL